MRYVVLEKEVGQTPLEAMNAWKSKHAVYRDTSSAYAGRLDPMASGKLLVLLGEECKQQEKYHTLDKEYEIEVLFDIGSDTGDALGLVKHTGTRTNIDTRTLTKALQREKGTYERTYPHFSSKTVNGKPLFLHALEGTLDTIRVPTHVEHVYAITLDTLAYIHNQELRKRIEAFLELVPTSNEPSKTRGADFRIQEVRKHWERVFEEASHRDFLLARMKVVCGAGTYMRTLAPRIGCMFGTDAIALSIHRTRIGKYVAGVWWKLYR